MTATISSARCSGWQISSKEITANRRERSGPQRGRRHSLWNGRQMRHTSRGKRRRIGHNRERAARRFQISQRCPPSCGLVPTGGRSVVAGDFGGLALWLDVDYIVEEWPILRSKPLSKVTGGCSF